MNLQITVYHLIVASPLLLGGMSQPKHMLHFLYSLMKPIRFFVGFLIILRLPFSFLLHLVAKVVVLQKYGQCAALQ